MHSELTWASRARTCSCSSRTWSGHHWPEARVRPCTWRRRCWCTPSRTWASRARTCSCSSHLVWSSFSRKPGRRPCTWRRRCWCTRSPTWASRARTAGFLALGLVIIQPEARVAGLAHGGAVAGALEPDLGVRARTCSCSSRTWSGHHSAGSLSRRPCTWRRRCWCTRARLGRPVLHLQLFFSHLVWSSFAGSLSRRPCTWRRRCWYRPDWASVLALAAVLLALGLVIIQPEA